MVDYYKEACRALENSETASLLGKIQKDWKKLVQMKIYYFAAVAHVSGETRWGAAWLRWGELPFAPILARAARARCGAVLATRRPTNGLWLLCGVLSPVSKISLELRSSDTADACFLAAAHGETGRGAAEVRGKGKQSRVGPSHPGSGSRSCPVGGLSPGDCHAGDTIRSPGDTSASPTMSCLLQAFVGVLRKPRYAVGSCGPRGLAVVFLRRAKAPTSVPTLIPGVSAGHLLPERSG